VRSLDPKIILLLESPSITPTKTCLIYVFTRRLCVSSLPRRCSGKRSRFQEG